ERELDELLAMLHPNVHSLFSRIRAERDLYEARYEWLKNLCGFGFRSSNGDWCELRCWDSVIVEKNCATVDEAVDFVLGGNGNEQATIKASA
ncbi:hypothetical protein, partial [Pseudomonas sp. FSL A6-1183]|uniref:hypothetical protein n=1 Tax=Pseudomonas sp. FSL A6-1183 TaxID=2662191 RepID=UPI0015B69DDC